MYNMLHLLTRHARHLPAPHAHPTYILTWQSHFRPFRPLRSLQWTSQWTSPELLCGPHHSSTRNHWPSSAHIRLHHDLFSLIMLLMAPGTLQSNLASSNRALFLCIASRSGSIVSSKPDRHRGASNTPCPHVCCAAYIGAVLFIHLWH